MITPTSAHHFAIQDDKNQTIFFSIHLKSNKQPFTVLCQQALLRTHPVTLTCEYSTNTCGVPVYKLPFTEVSEVQGFN